MRKASLWPLLGLIIPLNEKAKVSEATMTLVNSFLVFPYSVYLHFNYNYVCTYLDVNDPCDSLSFSESHDKTTN